MLANTLDLRKGQLGAIYALLAHFAGSHRTVPAQLHLPAGYGKTLVMLIASRLLNPDKQTLVVCSGQGLQGQLHYHFSVLYGEVSTPVARSENGALARTALGKLAPPPVSKSGVKRVQTKNGKGAKDMPDGDAQVVLAHPSSLDAYKPTNDAGNAIEVGLILVDEGHHLAADSWAAVCRQHPHARVVVVTATPFRTDSKTLPGKLAFSYPLLDAISEGAVANCVIETIKGDGDATDDAKISSRALKLLAEAKKSNPAAKLLVKFSSVDRLEALRKSYEDKIPKTQRGEGLLVVHSKMPDADITAAFEKAASNKWQIALSVEMLSEGIDSPDIRVLAVHDNMKSLGHFVQVAGRVGRVQLDTAGAAVPSHLVMLEAHLPTKLQGKNVKSLNDIANALASAVENQEQRTALKELIEDEHVPDDVLLNALDKLKLRRHARAFKAPAKGSLDWTKLSHVGNARLLGKVCHKTTNGELRLAMVSTPLRPYWLGELGVFEPEVGLLLTFETSIAIQGGTERLVFAATTTAHKALVDDLLEHFSDEGTPLRGFHLSKLRRIYSGAARVTYYNLGLRSRMTSPLVERYRTVTGPQIEVALESDTLRSFSQGHVIGKTIGGTGAAGDTQVLGIGSQSTIWGAGLADVISFCDDWLHPLAVKLCSSTAAPSATSLDDIALGEEADFKALPPGKGAAAFWGPATLTDQVWLEAEDKSKKPYTDVYLSACDISQPTVDTTKGEVKFSISYSESGSVVFNVDITIKEGSQLFESSERIMVKDASGVRRHLTTWLREDPPSLYLANASCLQGRTLTPPPSAGSVLQTLANIRHTMDWKSFNVRMEKPENFEPEKTKRAPTAAKKSKMKNFDPSQPNPTTGRHDDSIFTRLALVLKARVGKENVQLVVCDDDKDEAADFISMRGVKGGQVTVELYLCKKSAEDEPGLRSKDVEELWSQAFRASQLLTRQSLIQHFARRSMDRMVLKPPLIDAKKLATELLEQATSVDFELILVQPGIDLLKLDPASVKAASASTTIAHAFASIVASFQRRGIRLLVVGRIATPKPLKIPVKKTAPAKQTAAAKVAATSVATIPDIFGRLATI